MSRRHWLLPHPFISSATRNKLLPFDLLLFTIYYYYFLFFFGLLLFFSLFFFDILLTYLGFSFRMEIRGICNGTLKTCDNLSDHIIEDQQEPRLSVVFFILVALAGLTVFTNALILAAFYVERKLRTYAKCYIFNITIADLLVGLVCMPLRSTVHLYNGWHFGRVASILFLGFQNSILSVSVCGVIVIFIDRYIAILHPIKHFQRKSIHKATVVNIGTWILSFGLWMMITSVWDFVDPNNKFSSSGFSTPNYLQTKTTTILVSILRMVGPFLIIAGFYLRVYLRVRNIGYGHLSKGLKKRNTVPQHVGSGETGGSSEVGDKSKKDGVAFTSLVDTVSILSISLQVSSDFERTQKGRESDITSSRFKRVNDRSQNTFHTKTKRNHVLKGHRCGISLDKRISKTSKSGISPEGRKAMRTMTFLVLAFVATCLPNIVSIMINSLFKDVFDRINSVFSFMEISRWLSYSNSLINPFAYAMAQPLIRKTVLKILCGRKCE